MSISPRMRVDTAAAGMSPLLALISWQIAKASGSTDDDAAIAAWWSLLPLAIGALALRRTSWGRKSYPMPVFRESFSMANYLRALALWCALYAVLTAAVWFNLPG